MGGGYTPPPSPGQMGAGPEGVIFMMRQKNMIKCLTIMFDIFITADCFSPLDVQSCIYHYSCFLKGR